MSLMRTHNSSGLSAMSFLPRVRFGRDRRAEALERRVSSLQNALRECSEVASQWTTFRHQVTGAIAVSMLALGFALGVYREPITAFAGGLAQTVGLSRPAATDPYVAFQNSDYPSALRLARPLAEAGDARAQALLGLIFYRGYGVPQDFAETLKWFRRAAEEHDAGAQFYLGLMYSKGHGVPEDYAEGAKWYRLSADQGNPEAQYNLGVLYSAGEAWQADNVSAYMWFSLAAAHFPVSDPRHNTAVSSRDLIGKLMSREQIAEAQRRAREWTPISGT
jgi:hypothetical protein